MPSFSVGAGQVFQSNATVSNTFSGFQVQKYNSTYSIFQYQIPVAPYANYVQVNYNSSWVFYSAFPSTYLVNTRLHYVLLENVGGYSLVQVNLIQPSPQIGSSSFVSVQPYFGSVSLSIPLSFTVKYTPFQSSHSYSLFSETPFFSLPYGSTMTLTVQNQWNQTVGKVSNYLVDKSSVVLPVQLDLSYVHIDFTNTTGLQTFFEANGINVSANGYNVYLANNSVYRWTTSVYSALKGKMVNYTGTLATDKPEMTLIISTNPAPASYTIEVFGYAGSSVGQFLNSGPATGNPNVTLTVNGHKESLNTQYQSTVGTTLNIVITDPLGQVLLETNVTLLQTGNVISLTIQKPSYIFGLINEETVPASSPLATQWNNLSVQNSTRHFNFTTSVNQESEVYLLGGENYTMFTHDNVTNFINFTLNSNQFYVIHGQNITQATAQEIESYLENQTGSGPLSLIPVSAPNQAPINTMVSFSLTAYYSNSTELDSTQLRKSSLLTLITNVTTGNLSTAVPAYSYSGSTLHVNFSLSVPGFYTVFIQVENSNHKGHYSQTFEAIRLINKSIGMGMQATGPSQIVLNNTYNYTIAVSYGNGTAMNLHDTGSVYNNTTIQIFNGLDPVQGVNLITYHAGIILFNVTFNKTGGYTLCIQSHARLNGYYDQATALVPVQVYPSARLLVEISFSGPTNALLGAKQTFTETVYGEGINATTMASAFNNTYVTLYENSTYLATVYPYAYSGNNIFFNYTFTSTGNYTAIVSLSLRGIDLADSIAFPVSAPQKVSIGMAMAGTGPSQIQEFAYWNYTLQLTYTNGTPLDLADTYASYQNLSIIFYNGYDAVVVQQPSWQPVTYAAGIITFQVYFPVTGGFTIEALTHANLSGSYAQATAIIPATVVAPQQVAHYMRMVIAGGTHATVGSPYNYSLFVEFANGTSMNLAETGWVYSNLSLAVYNGTAAASLAGYSAGVIYFTVNYSTVGNFVIVAKSHAAIPETAYAQSILSVVTEPRLSVNMILSVSGPSSFQKNTTAYYVVAVAYPNGTSMDSTDTLLVLNNMQVQLFRNGQFFSLETPYYIQPGKIGIKLNLSQIGSNYVLDVLVTTFSLNGHNTSAQATTSFSVLAYNPNTNFWDSLLNGIAGGFYKVSLYLGIIVTIIAFVLYVYRFVTRKKRELKKQARRVQADLVAEAMYGSLSEQEKKRIIMDYQRKHSGILHRWKMDLVKGFDKLHKKRGE